MSPQNENAVALTTANSQSNPEPVTQFTTAEPAALSPSVDDTETKALCERMNRADKEWCERSPETAVAFDKWCAERTRLTRIPESEEASTGLIESAADFLKPCPYRQPGKRTRHTWICYAACRLVELGCADGLVEEIVTSLLTRDPKPNEIEDAIRWARGNRETSTPRWQPPNPLLIAEAIKNGPSLPELITRSPETITFDWEPKTDDYIDTLFPDNPLLCAGVTDSRFVTTHRENLRGLLSAYPLIVPSPMTSKTGLTKNGTESQHCLANTGPRRYLVIEFDNGILDRQAALLWCIATKWPLALIIFSGNKSLHGWIYCAGQPEDKIENLCNYASALGADRSTFSRLQFVRTPDATRYAKTSGLLQAELKEVGITVPDHRRQAILYFNPEVIR